MLLCLLVFNSYGSDSFEDADVFEGGINLEQVDSNEKFEFADVIELADKKEFITKGLNRITTFLNSKEVMITGYPYAYPMGEGKDVEFVPVIMEMIDGMNNSVDNVGVRGKFKNEIEPRTMKIGELFDVKGTIEVSYNVRESFWNSTRIFIEDAEYIENPEAKSGEISPVEGFDVSKQIFLDDLYSVMYNHYQSLFDKSSITVTGEYHSTTVSKNYEGTEILEIRVDLGDRENKVGCELNEEPDGDALNAQRSAGKAVSISGRFSGITFGNPRISASDKVKEILDH